ncbi:hypothetical protein DSO57_1013619 [Entomophthora muscae]|uniref:Uncharacterized protein n=1 Tax=Entomophthora muscae TaxID=34485 RepID=A0ACC2SJ12_9FUNG|nr:hypothetical protein DSO57_1013619 [Entomophthora muscae]
MVLYTTALESFNKGQPFIKKHLPRVGPEVLGKGDCLESRLRKPSAPVGWDGSPPHWVSVGLASVVLGEGTDRSWACTLATEKYLWLDSIPLFFEGVGCSFLSSETNVPSLGKYKKEMVHGGASG